MAKIKLKASVVSAPVEEIHKGWVRISEELRGDIPTGAYVRLSANGRGIFCQLRGTPDKTGIVQMGEYYRSSLGWKELPSGKVEITIKSVWFLGKFHALVTHPDDVVRTAIWLAVLSVLLGFVGLGLGLLSLFVS